MFKYLPMNIREQLKERKLLKRDVCKHLGCTMPTLMSKLDNPAKLTLGDVEKLKQLGITFNI